MFEMNKNKLNAKEFKILTLIKEAGKPITTGELIDDASGLTKNIVHPAIRTLLKMELICVADTVLEKNIVSRRFTLSPNSESVIQQMFQEEFRTYEKLLARKKLFCALFDASDSEDERSQILQDLKSILEQHAND